MNDFATYEYVVAQRKEGKWRFRRIALIVFYVLFVIVWFAFGFLSHLFPLLALVPLTTWILVFFTWRYVNVEYEYSMTSGSVVFSNIYGNRSRKTVVEFKIKDCTLVAPLGESKERIAAFAPEKTINALSSSHTPDAYVALVNSDGKHIAVYFEATSKALKIFRFYNAPCTVVRDVRY